MLSKIREIINNYKTQQQYKRVVAYLAQGFSLVNCTKWSEYETNRYIYCELGIDHFNYEIVDLDNNLVEYIPGNIVAMLPQDEYRAVIDNCKLGDFYRVEPIVSEYDNLTFTEAQRVFSRFESSDGINRARLLKTYPNLLADYQIEYNPTLAYDKDCKPTVKQGKNALANALLRQATYNQDGTQQKYYIS